MTEWKKEISADRPSELQTVAPGLFVQRKEISQVEHEADPVAGTDAYTDFECLSREITASEYHMLESITEIDNSKAIDDYTMQLIEEGVL